MFVASEFVAGLCLAGLAGGLGLGQRKVAWNWGGSPRTSFLKTRT